MHTAEFKLVVLLNAGLAKPQEHNSIYSLATVCKLTYIYC